MKYLHVLLISVLLFPQFIFSTPAFAEQKTLDSGTVDKNKDFIDLPNDNITLNIGDIFYPENYATAYRDNEEVPYGNDFTAIYNDVDTSKPGHYKVIYRLHYPSGAVLDKTMNVMVQNNDRIDLLNDSITLNIGDIFYPENYATAYRDNEEVPYGNDFTAIYNDVDTSKPGHYKVIYRLHYPSGAVLDKTMNVMVQNNDEGTRLIPVLRSYNTNDGDHLYTLSQEEYNWITELKWNAEGTAFKSVLSDYEGAIPVYRLYNSHSGEHFYTVSESEYNNVALKGWTKEQVGFYMVPKEKGNTVYRVFNPNATGPGSHLFTASKEESTWLINQGWKDEGIAFYSAK
ncbi:MULTISPECIES: hypothetical protein [Enterococcus]|uniref:hypothetical protein n=1 Tax=Enterococcus sp. AZ103 TaxID=2774628 RepID=UPI003F2821F2